MKKKTSNSGGKKGVITRGEGKYSRSFTEEDNDSDLCFLAIPGIIDDWETMSFSAMYGIEGSISEKVLTEYTTEDPITGWSCCSINNNKMRNVE